MIGKKQSEQNMTDQPDKLNPQQIAELCEQYFSQAVQKVTAPGGKSRESLRVHFPDRQIIVTQRRYPGRMRMEIEVLKRLFAEGAPVPKYLGGTEQLFFQEDVGSGRLTVEINRQNPVRQLELATAAFASQAEILDAGKATGLAELVPALGEAQGWVRGFVETSFAVADKYGAARPGIDVAAMVQKLHVSADTFVKWDARPGNGAIQPDGRVFWYDWEHCGRRQGMEDFAWLAGDEFWPLGAEIVLPVLDTVLPLQNRAKQIDYLSHFITFHMVQRLNMIHIRHQEDGWTDPAQAMRYDHIGTDAALTKRLCRKAMGWADRSPLTRPMVAFFDECHDAVDGLVQPPKTDDQPAA